ncbi:MAG: hypothetical protein NTY53_03995 [Kiritimatiellaeota bacterium]|nr:hypothetical protein [Kiritimatiellota bacterium]
MENKFRLFSPTLDGFGTGFSKAWKNRRFAFQSLENRQRKRTKDFVCAQGGRFGINRALFAISRQERKGTK